MKLNLIFAFLFVFLILSGCYNSNSKSQQETSIKKSSTTAAKISSKPKSIDEKIKACDVIIKNTDALSLKKVYSRYEDQKSAMKYNVAIFNAFYNLDELLKLVEIVGKDGYIVTSTYYFNKDKVIYSTALTSFKNSEFLYQKEYIEDESIYRILSKEKDVKDETIDLLSQKEEIWDEKKVKISSDSFKIAFLETMKRFKASKIIKN
jgi:hypothetical protein